MELYVKPVIEIDINQVKYFVGKDLKKLKKEMEELRLKVKKATGYTWDNSHFRLTIHNKPVMNISFYTTQISIYNHKTGDHIGDFNKNFTMIDATVLKDWALQLEKGLQRCLDCGKWVKEGKGYSYAGFVCNDCYDPGVHLPPDPS